VGKKFEKKEPQQRSKGNITYPPPVRALPPKTQPTVWPTPRGWSSDVTSFSYYCLDVKIDIYAEKLEDAEAILTNLVRPEKRHIFQLERVTQSAKRYREVAE